MFNGESKRSSLKIIAATSVVIFSLMAAFAGSIAWFKVNRNLANSASGFQIYNPGCDLGDIYLYKFNYWQYDINGTKEYDYLSPAKGEVKKYQFDTTLQQFGETVEGTWCPTTVMNTYDPIEMLISDKSLADLNCNVIYEVNLTSETFANCLMNVRSLLIPNRQKQSNEIYLSSCINFDVYLESDIADDRQIGGVSIFEGTGYRPSYIKADEVLTVEEEVYYRISYLSSLSGVTHANFFSGSSDNIALANDLPAEFVNESFKVYINANYAPAQLTQYEKEIYDGDIIAVYDFIFSFAFREQSEQS